VVPDLDALQSEADALDCSIECRDGFVTTPALIELVGRRIDERMQSVSQPERIKKFLLLDRAFELGEDELTATLKIRRRHIIDKHEEQLAALYEE